jgi:hypothetical protein
MSYLNSKNKQCPLLTLMPNQPHKERNIDQLRLPLLNAVSFLYRVQMMTLALLMEFSRLSYYLLKNS